MKSMLRILATSLVVFAAASALHASGSFSIKPGESIPEVLASRVEGKGTLFLLVSPNSTKSHAALRNAESYIWQPLKERGFNVTAICVGSDSDAKKLASTLALTFPVVADKDRKIFDSLATAGVPRAIIVDGSGTIVEMSEGWTSGMEAKWRAVGEDLAAGKVVVPTVGSSYAEELGARDIRGEKAPDVPVVSWVNEPPALTGKEYILYDFWATWCGPCIGSLNEAEKLHGQFEGKLVTIAVSNEDLDTVSAAVKKYGWKQPIGVDPEGTMMTALEIRGIPHAFLKDPSGKVIWQGHPSTLWQKDAHEMKRLLGMLGK